MTYFRALRVALGFLTTLPVPLIKDWRDDDLRLAVRAYPLVGLILGGLLSLAFAFLPFSPLLLGVLVTTLWLGLTGALHFDGFCDMADAAFAPRSVEQRWEIAKDSRIGGFALAAGCLLILTKVAAVASLSQWFWLIIIPILSRSAVIYAMARHPVYDVSLLGRRSHLRWNEIYLPIALGILISGGCALFFSQTLSYFVLLVVVAITVMFAAWWMNQQMNGLGGDAYGALIELNETVMLVVATVL